MTLGLQAKLDIQRVLILHQHCNASIAGIVAAALLIGAVAYTHLTTWLFLAWFIGILSAVPIRTVLRQRLSKIIKGGDLSAPEALKWEKSWIISTVIPSIAITSVVFFPFEHDHDHLTIYLFIALVMVAMISGSIISSVTSIKTFMVFMNVTIPPFFLMCLYKNTLDFLALGAFLALFYVFFFMLALKINKTVLDAITLQIRQKDMADKDTLTDLWNRRKLFSVVESIKGQKFSVLLIDIDNFKQLNDQFGHTHGDEVLIDISNSILNSVSDKELVVRYGGEEFLVLVFEQDVEEVDRLAEDIRINTIQNCKLTVSIGIATTEQSEDFDTIVELADRAMYEAKRQGRNRVHTSRF